MPDLENPLAEYSAHFKGLHERTVSDYFENLVRASGVDEAANTQLVAQIAALNQAIESKTSSRNWWYAAVFGGVAIMVAAAAAAFSLQGVAYSLLIVTITVAVVLASVVRCELSQVNRQLQELVGKRDVKRAHAWNQMEPLNRLHTWGVAAQLFQQTCPEIGLDRFVSSARIDDLARVYGLSRDVGDGCSAIFAQSGAVKGNPFVVVRYLKHWIGKTCYTGSLEIRWTETVQNAEGRWVDIARSEILNASVYKPIPVYEESTSLAFGHEAAPNLSFSRLPSNLSGLADGRFNDWRKNQRVNKVARIARRDIRTGSGQRTVMSNRDFESMFHAIDRNNEVEFRLLFTPLAQQEMVTLLNDRVVGYGDDFAFTKLGKVNFVEAQHFHHARLDDSPDLFTSYDLAGARASFAAFHAKYFKSLYFGLAPLLTVPLYRDARSTAGPDARPPVYECSTWEHESVANLFGDALFAHPQSITRSLLRTTAQKVNDSVDIVSVTAQGYRGVNRVDYVQVRGRDGRGHSVAVPWVEYIPVQAGRRILVGVIDSERGTPYSGTALDQNWFDALRLTGSDDVATYCRGSIVAAVLEN